MLELLLKHGLLYTISNIFVRGINFFLLPLYTRILSPEDYGLIDMVTIAANFVNYIVTLEITQSIARFLPESDKNEKSIYISTSLMVVILGYMIFTIIMLCFTKEWEQYLLTINKCITLNFGYIVLAYFSSNGLFILLQSQLRWGLEVKKCNIVNVTVALTTTFLSYILVVVYSYTFHGILLGLTLGNLIGSLLCIYFSREYINLKWDYSKVYKMLAFSFPLVPSSISSFLCIYIDRIFIAELLSRHELGLYGIAYRLAAVSSLLMFGVQSAITPIIYSNYKKSDSNQELAEIFNYFCIASFILFLVMSIWIKEILYVFTTPEYYDAYICTIILFPALILGGVYVFAPGLGIAKKTKIIATISIVAGVINAILGYIFISKWGIEGAAMATLIASVINAGFYFYLGEKYYNIPYDWMKILKAGGIVSCASIISNIIEFQNEYIIFFFKIGIFFLATYILFKIMLSNLQLEKLRRRI